MLSSQPWVERCVAAKTEAEAHELVARYEPHIGLIDLFVGEEPGAGICTRLRAAKPDMRVLLMAGAGGISPSIARDAGASGFLTKEASAQQVIRAVQLVGMGLSVFPPRDEYQRRCESLSRRELEVLRLVASGATNIEIAGRLQLSPNTVKEYASGMYRKLSVRNRAEAVQRAQVLGLLG